ncbi:SLOG family protein [Undibacterium sp.]|uniref:SLOG family protein n=1 Tax=Undibacterium sp. TaxID=1914977 RepID=UPI002731A518|nr:SLOG family protein [Undibacterium sp.]MDP1980099.1 SLOG family protein [Undibacterium sp.]
MRVLITGSTSWESQAAIRLELAKLSSDTIIVTGDTPGIDAHAKVVALEFGFAVDPMKKPMPTTVLSPVKDGRA